MDQRSASMHSIAEAAKSIQNMFENRSAIATTLNQGGITVPVVASSARQNLLNAMATNMTGMSDAEVQYMSDAVFKAYAEILSRYLLKK